MKRAAEVALALVPLSGRSLDVKITTHQVRRAAATSPKPTHFVSLRLGSRDLHGMVASMQQEIIRREPDASGCDVPPEKSHLTAFVLSLPTPEALDEARLALADCAALPEAQEPIPPSIYICGLGGFGQRVCYARVRDDAHDFERVARLVAGAAQKFAARGLAVQQGGAGDGGASSWVPHLTLLKTSRVATRSSKARRSSTQARRPAKIRPASYADLAETNGADFGVHPLPMLELCAMQGVAADGFYCVEAALPLGRQ
jgi:hypothetical protein